MPTLSPALLDEVVRRIVREYDPDRVILFGSHAWGRPHEQSDLDLLVIVAEGDGSPSRRAARGHRCLRGVGVPVDLLVRTREEMARYGSVRASLEAEILDRGRLVYGRGETRAGAGLAAQGIT